MPGWEWAEVSHKVAAHLIQSRNCTLCYFTQPTLSEPPAPLHVPLRPCPTMAETQCHLLTWREYIFCLIKDTFLRPDGKSKQIWSSVRTPTEVLGIAGSHTLLFWCSRRPYSFLVVGSSAGSGALSRSTEDWLKSPQPKTRHQHSQLHRDRGSPYPTASVNVHARSSAFLCEKYLCLIHNLRTFSFKDCLYWNVSFTTHYWKT